MGKLELLPGPDAGRYDPWRRCHPGSRRKRFSQVSHPFQWEQGEEPAALHFLEIVLEQHLHLAALRRHKVKVQMPPDFLDAGGVPVVGASWQGMCARETIVRVRRGGQQRGYFPPIVTDRLLLGDAVGIEQNLLVRKAGR